MSYSVWSSFVNYLVGDIASYNGIVYEALQANTNVLPTTLAPNWVVYGGGTQTLSLAGDSISLSDGGGSVTVGAASSVAGNTAKLTAQSYTPAIGIGLDSTNFTSEVEIGTVLAPRDLTVNGIITPEYIQDSVPSVGSSGQVLSIAPSGGLLWTTQPAFVYYVATNGLAGASGSITDPLSTITEALTKPSQAVAGKTIYVAPGQYTEDVDVNVSKVSIIGMSDSTQASKRARFTANWTVSATSTSVPTTEYIVISNLEIEGKVGGNAINYTGAGCRLTITNCLITSLDPSISTIICNTGTAGSPAQLGQLILDNANITTATAGNNGTGLCLDVINGEAFSIRNSDLTQNGLATPLRVVSPGRLLGATNSTFECKNSFPTAITITSLGNTSAQPATFTNCNITATPTTIIPLISVGSTSVQTVGFVSCNIVSKGTSDTSATTYIQQTGSTVAGGNTVSVARCNFATATGLVASIPQLLTINPFKATTNNNNNLFYFSNLFFATTFPSLITLTMPTTITPPTVPTQNYTLVAIIKSA